MPQQSEGAGREPRPAPARPEGAPAGRSNLDLVLDIPVTVSVELGRTRMLVMDLLRLGQGSVVELNKLAGEPLDIYVNKRLVARGEAVVVNDRFGVRLTDVVAPADRVDGLRS